MTFPELFQDKIANRELSLYRQFCINAVQQSIRVLDSARHWNKLLFKESLWIKQEQSPLNCGLKATKELALFN